MGITHHKVATLPDDPSAEVGKDEWNEDHDLDDITSLPTAEVDGTKVLAPDGLGGVEWRDETGGGGGGAPTNADYLVGTANASLSNEIAVGTTPGGQLGGTWASPTVDASHSGSTHAATQAAAEATAATALSGHEADTTSIHGIADTSVLATATTLATAVSDHAGASDPHTGYRLESADHTHASSGLQGGTVAYSAITGTPAAERAASSSTPAAVGTAAIGVGTTDARADHVHATGAGTPSTQAFGDAAATGSGPAAAMTDHKHAFPALGTTAAAIGTSAGGSAVTPSKSDHVHATGAGTPSTQAIGDAASTGSGPAAAMTDHKHAMPAASSLAGYEYDYAQNTSSVNITATTEATANTVVTANAVTYDGSTTIMIEFYAYSVRPDSTGTGNYIELYLYDGSSSIGYLGTTRSPAAANAGWTVHAVRRLTPSAAAHTYSVRGDVNTGTGVVASGAGGNGAISPVFIRQTRV